MTQDIGASSPTVIIAVGGQFRRKGEGGSWNEVRAIVDGDIIVYRWRRSDGGTRYATMTAHHLSVYLEREIYEVR